MPELHSIVCDRCGHVKSAANPLAVECADCRAGAMRVLVGQKTMDWRQLANYGLRRAG